MKTINARERLDETVPGSPGHPNGEGIARIAKPRGDGMYTTGQAAARLRISPSRCEALLRLWGVEVRGDRLVVTTELFGRLQRAVRER